MIKYDVLRKIATIHEWNNTSLELNIVKWGTGKPKYDLRRWTDGEPQKGVTLEEEDLKKLFYSIGNEMEYDFSSDAEGDVEEEIEEDYEEEDIDFRCFFVHGDMSSCDANGHDYYKVVARTPIFAKNNKVQEIEVPAYHCKDCKAYYISESVYKKIESMGRLLCQLISKTEFEELKKLSSLEDLNPQSKLAMIGYNVGSKDALSAKQRQTLLEYAIREGVVTKQEAISYLKFFIKLHEGKTNMEHAIQKWREDISFLSGQPLTDKRIIGVARIVR